MLKHCIDSYIP